MVRPVGAVERLWLSKKRDLKDRPLYGLAKYPFKPLHPDAFAFVLTQQENPLPSPTSPNSADILQWLHDHKTIDVVTLWRFSREFPQGGYLWAIARSAVFTQRLVELWSLPEGERVYKLAWYGKSALGIFTPQTSPYRLVRRYRGEPRSRY